MRWLTSTDTALLDALGGQRLAELKARSTALDFPDAIDFLRVETDRVLAQTRRPKASLQVKPTLGDPMTRA